MIEYLDVDDLLIIAEYALRGAQPLLRDPGALAAAAARPMTTVFGEDAYPTLAHKAAALLHSIVRNHPLIDGNKRLGWLSAVELCQRNGHDLYVADVDASEAFVLSVATGVLDVDGASKFIADHLS